ncbi:hypothetical protein Goklo_024012 [Gossypium klotzschianum]|uniref:Uncharacterized protein n=1 Tax=Gossypium klotzschianum TaxID=34286 RepID=A0A7J8WED0_9ROSI|nr:hypothetical protein [Gossypium klotzschianum]
MLAIACLQFGGDGNEVGEGAKVVGSKYGEGEGGEVVHSKGGEGECGGGESDRGGEEGVRDESNSDSEDENAYLMKVMYLSDGDDNKELQEARKKEVFEAKVPEKVDGEGLKDNIGREYRNETEYFDSDDHGSILGLEDDDNTDICRRRSKFLTYNPNLASPHFCVGMLFKYG